MNLLQACLLALGFIRQYSLLTTPLLVNRAIVFMGGYVSSNDDAPHSRVITRKWEEEGASVSSEEEVTLDHAVA